MWTTCPLWKTFVFKFVENFSRCEKALRFSSDCAIMEAWKNKKSTCRKICCSSAANTAKNSRRSALICWNSTADTNLTAITEEKDVLYKHFVDSAAARGLFSNGASVAEIGSGAGFPSFPLKILREDLSFTLFESVGKKCDFLRFIVDKLNFYEMHICNMQRGGCRRKRKIP